MKERDFQKKLLAALRAHAALKDAVIFKHSDWVAGGIPDVSITLNGVTTWFELKVFPGTPTKLQAHYLRRLLPRAYVVTAMKNGEIFLDRVEAILTMRTAIETIVGICK